MLVCIEGSREIESRKHSNLQLCNVGEGNKLTTIESASDARRVRTYAVCECVEE